MLRHWYIALSTSSTNNSSTEKVEAGTYTRAMRGKVLRAKPYARVADGPDIASDGSMTRIGANKGRMYAPQY